MAGGGGRGGEEGRLDLIPFPSSKDFQNPLVVSPISSLVSLTFAFSNSKGFPGLTRQCANFSSAPLNCQ